MSSPGIAASAGEVRLTVVAPPTVRFKSEPLPATSVTVGGSVAIGRDDQADVVLIGGDEVGYVSAFHAIVAYSEIGGTWVIRDDHSSQGTTVTAADGNEGLQAAELLPNVAVPLLDGDRITLAGVVDLTVAILAHTSAGTTRGRRGTSGGMAPLRLLDANHRTVAQVLIGLVREGAHHEKNFSTEVVRRSHMDRAAVYRAAGDLQRYPQVSRRLELPDEGLRTTRMKPLAVAVSQALSWIEGDPGRR